MNVFKKYCAGVFVMKSENDYSHGDIATIETKFGKEIQVKIWKNIGKYKDGSKAYSIIRLDGMDSKGRLLKKSDQRKEWAEKAEERSNADNLSQSEHDFLKLGEPVKIGHHSQRKHERLLKRLDNQMRRGYEESKKAEYHKEKAESLEKRAESIFIDTPDCLNDLKEYVKNLEIEFEKSTGFVRTNLRSKIKRWYEKLKYAKKLWEL